MNKELLRKIILSGSRQGPQEGFLFGGQSNYAGGDTVALSTSPSSRHWQPNIGVRSRSTDPLIPLVHLHEQPTDTGYGTGETPASAFAQMYDQLDSAGPRWFCANHAKGGIAIAGIKKGGTDTCYVDGQAQVSAGGVPTYGIGFGHGETDTQTNNTGYPADYVQLQTDYTNDIQAKTGQNTQVIIYALQNAAYPPGSTSATGAVKTGSCQLTYLDKAVNLPTKFKCIGSGGNALPSNWITDGLHYTAGYKRVLAAYLAKFVYRTRHAQDDLPLYPTSAVDLTGTTTEVTFHVPVAPLVWRYDLFQPTTTGNAGALLGIKCYDDSGTPPSVTDVQISASNKIVVTRGAWVGANREIRFGFSTSQASGTGGTPLADSDATVDPYGWPLPNFCCMSYVSVP